MKAQVPHLVTCCDPDRQTKLFRHELCGGWWCTCPCHDNDTGGDPERFARHVDHEWEQVGGCVYCCGERLYAGTAPKSRCDRAAVAGAADGAVRASLAEWVEMRRAVMIARRAHEGRTATT